MTMKKIVTFIALFLALSLPCLAQATLGNTTLSAAMTTTSNQAVRVAATTGITAGSTMIFVDKEAMFVNGVSGTTLTVMRGYGGTAAGTHASGSRVWLGPANYFMSKDKPEGGSCTAGNELVLPIINIANGSRWNCVSSIWSQENEFISLYTAKSATPGTYRQIRGELTTYSTMTSGNLVGVRGAVTMPAASTVSGGYLYGAQGKAITGTGTFSGTDIFGVFGQFDVSGGTVSGGHASAIGGNIYGYNSGTSTILNTLYLEAAGGGVINSHIQTFGKATYWADIQTNAHTPEANTTCTPSAVTGATGGIKVLVDGVVRWIPLAATCP
jgi:hypothetical protein